MASNSLYTEVESMPRQRALTFPALRQDYPQLITKIGLRQLEHARMRVQIVKFGLVQFGSELNQPCFRFVLEELLEPKLKRFVLKA